jgi:hypothetical protein
MTSERLDIKHKELLYQRLRIVDTQVSEYSFPNLYLFRNAHAYEVIKDKEIFIKGITYDGYSYLMPTIDIHRIDPDYLRDIMDTVDFLFPIPEAWLSSLSSRDFAFESKEGEMDYVYTVERMSTYRGRRLHKKRNLLKQFTTGYQHEAKPLLIENRNDAFSILNAWLDESGQQADETDYVPCKEALKMSEELVLCGVIYYADNKPAGFILGEEVNNETFVIHFAKAIKKFKGVYQYMFNSFAKILPVKYTYLNFEQDLEKEALRIAKSSYIPAYMLKKFRVGISSL